jgi:ABC-type thiamine transport system ATPase subunit
MSYICTAHLFYRHIMNSPQGSIWRKWDLHVHTPASPNYTGDFDGLIQAINASEAAVVGINDYFTLEGYEQLIAEKDRINKVLLPAVELRMNNILTNKKNPATGIPLNFHIIFDNDGELFERIKIFLSNINCTGPSGVVPLGTIPRDSRIGVTVNFENVVEQLINARLRKHSLIWLPYDEYGGADEVDPNDTYFKSFLVKSSDIIGSGNQKQVRFFNWSDKSHSIEEYESWLTKPKPCIKGSDSHSSKDLIGHLKDADSKPTERFCWIKADPTFRGLQQIVLEPEARVFIGELPPKLSIVRNNKQNFIARISLTSSGNNGEWFDEFVPMELNADLVAIIGKKGQGKSALADLIASAGNAANSDFSFLTVPKFLGHPAHKKYVASLEFADGQTISKAVKDAAHDSTKPERVVYLSQNFVARLCEENEATLLKQEVDRVVFGHIPHEDQQGSLSLKELQSKIFAAVDNEIRKKRNHLQVANISVCHLEEKLTAKYRRTIEHHLQQLQEQYNLLLGEEPSLESLPTENVDSPELVEVEKRNADVDLLRASVEEVQSKLDGIVQNLQSTKDLLAQLKSVADLVTQIKNDESAQATFDRIGLSFDDILRLEINEAAIIKVLTAQENDRDQARQSRLELESKLVKELEVLTLLKSKLDDGQRKHQALLQAHAEWKASLEVIMGAEEDPATILSYQAELRRIETGLPMELAAAQDKRNSLALDIASLVLSKRSTLQTHFKYAQDYSTLRGDQFAIPAEERVMFQTRTEIGSDFLEQFLAFVNQGRRGSFHGSEEGRSFLKALINSSRLNSANGLVALATSIVDALNHNLPVDPERIDPKQVTIIDEQLKRSKQSLYDLLFGFEYVESGTVIEYAEKAVEQLSPGERGALLLMFYLLVDADSRPIIIDQPEENLDNETVFRRLVAFIKKVKEERQIIMVTHNPNLAIVCDAEQILYCAMDKSSNNVTHYHSGSIEADDSRGVAIDVLEGTVPAFLNRQNKYQLAG